MTVTGDAGGAGPAEHLRLTLLAGVLTNEAEAYRSDDGRIVVQGDPTETALLVAALAYGMEPDDARDEHEVFAGIPFEPERRYSATIRDWGDGHAVFVKGAPETVTAMCADMLTPDGVAPLDHEAVAAAASRMAAEGLRVLAMAWRELPARLAGPDAVGEPHSLTFLGLQGMMDPPRAGVKEAIAGAKEAGVRVVMITGDHAATAQAIAADLGIAGGAVLTGAEVAALSDEELGHQVSGVSLYARMSPEDKLRITRAFTENGEVVAVTGDGVNDAPALRAAAIGVAMGRGGTDVAREASDMVLADDNFVSILAAVEEGRVTFDNIRKATFFLISTATATILAIIAALWMRWPLVMLPAQLL